MAAALNCRSSDYQTIPEDVFCDSGEVTVGAAYQVVGGNRSLATNSEMVPTNFNVMAHE